MTARIIIPGRLARAGVASRHPVAYAGVKFLEAVHRADGEPLVVAPRELNEEAARRLLGHADGLLLIGGPDVNADLYGSRQGPHDYPAPKIEDRFEIALVQIAIEMQVPTVAICRGMQVVNVALGGTLEQHITGRTDLQAHSAPGFPKPPAGTIGPLNEITLVAGLPPRPGVRRHGAATAPARTTRPSTGSARGSTSSVRPPTG